MNRFFVSLILIITLTSSMAGCGEIIRYNGEIFIHKRNVATNIRGERMFWRHLPVVLIVSSNISNREKEKIDLAANVWEEAVGCNLFDVERGIETRDEGTVFLYKKKLGANGDNKVLGEAIRYYEVDSIGIPVWIRFARLRMDSGIGLNTWEKTLIHELGHILALGHDRAKKSIMYPYLNESRGVIMQDDIKAIKRYCSRSCAPNYCPLPQ